MSNESFELLLLSEKLPSPVGVGMKILELTRSENVSIEELGAVIMADSALATRIIKVANSALNCSAHPAISVQESIMRLGTQSVRDMSLAFSLITMPKGERGGVFDFDLHWSKSLARAVSARILSEHVGVGKPEEAFLCGLLAEIGRLALASVHTKQYAQIIDSGMVHDVDALVEAERDAFGIDHRELASRLLAEWKLPDQFSESIRTYSAEPEEGENRGLGDLSDILYAADVLAAIMVTTEATPDSSWLDYGERLDWLRAALQLDEDGLIQLGDSCRLERRTWSKELGFPRRNEPGFRSVVEKIEEVRMECAGRDLQRPTFSRDAVAAAVAAAAAATPRQLANAPIRVLVVDDSETDQLILKRALCNESYKIECVIDGKTALESVLRHAPDLILAEWHLPKMDGLELCRSLRKTEVGKHVFYVLLTGSEDEDSIVTAFDAGVDDFITKPFMPRLLLARIKGGERIVRLQRTVEMDKQVMREQLGELATMTRRLRSAALTDELTKLPNRRYAMRRMDMDWSESKRNQVPMCLIMSDIDHFKSVNDEHGHDVGDVVLRETAQVLASVLRSNSVACRLGGEEFLIICRETTQEDGMIIAERVRRTVQANVIKSGSFHRNVTLSLGVAGLNASTPDIEALLKAADEAVYLAKSSGRNCVTGAQRRAA